MELEHPRVGGDQFKPKAAEEAPRGTRVQWARSGPGEVSLEVCLAKDGRAVQGPGMTGRHTGPQSAYANRTAAEVSHMLNPSQNCKPHVLGTASQARLAPGRPRLPRRPSPLLLRVLTLSVSQPFPRTRSALPASAPSLTPLSLQVPSPSFFFFFLIVLECS